eukprot:1156865-Pelagomonas_calceolata.AAC.16
MEILGLVNRYFGAAYKIRRSANSNFQLKGYEVLFHSSKTPSQITAPNQVIRDDLEPSYLITHIAKDLGVKRSSKKI